MAAGTGITVTNIPVVRNTAIDVSVSQMTAATNSGTGGASDTDFFTITAPKEDQKIVILVNNGTGQTITASIVNGEMWGATGASAGVSVATGKTFAWTIDTAKYKTNAGTIKVLLAPTTSTALNASAKANVTCLTLG